MYVTYLCSSTTTTTNNNVISTTIGSIAVSTNGDILT